MKTINYKFVWKDARHRIKEEACRYVEDDVTAIQDAQAMLDNFNRTLRPGELPRTLCNVREIKNSKKVAEVRHVWEKISLVTKRGGYDRYKCKNCKATGKLHRLGDLVIPDGKFTGFCKIKK
jgi:hypothetical protein